MGREEGNQAEVDSGSTPEAGHFTEWCRGKLSPPFTQFICMSVLPAFLCVPRMCLMPEEARVDTGSSGTGFRDGCEPPCGLFKSNNQPPLTTGPSPQLLSPGFDREVTGIV